MALKPIDVLSWSLAFVVGWFGINEILWPAQWTTFAPGFLGSGQLVTYAVMLHGIVLTSCALMLVANYKRGIAAAILVLVFAEVVLELIAQMGLSDIAVRDIGLGGMALGIALLSRRR